MEEFQCKTTIYSGPGAVSALAGMGGQRLMLVTDPFFMKNGTAQRIAQTAKCAQVEYFDKVQPDPSVELAAEGTARLKEFAPDLLVALGGGSAMDCAKAMAYFAKGNYKLVAIPTTSGSGSEVTDFAILTHNKVKHPLVDKRLRPDAAILDSDLLQELPKGLIAETGFDALSHAVEAYAAKNAGAMTDLYAREAFSSAFAALPASYAGRKDVRLKVHQAATMAGIAFTQAGLGLCHAMAHSLGGLFHVPHGRLNAILLPSVITCNAHVAAKKYAELARAAGIGGSADTYPGIPLRPGDRSQDVRHMQGRLNEVARIYTGINTQTVDGAYGNNMTNAVRRFQRQFSLSADGILGKDTWNKIVSVHNAMQAGNPTHVTTQYPGVPLRVGSTGDYVRFVQSYLNGISGRPLLTVDGNYGQNTTRAVGLFQATAGLPVDGVVGSATWAALIPAFNATL